MTEKKETPQLDDFIRDFDELEYKQSNMSKPNVVLHFTQRANKVKTNMVLR